MFIDGPPFQIASCGMSGIITVLQGIAWYRGYMWKYLSTRSAAPSRIYAKRRLMLAWGICLCLAAAVAVAHAQVRPHVLLLNSYHQGYRWTDEVVQAIRSTLSSVLPVEIHVEYMDAKRIESPDYLDQYADLLNRKYAGLQLSVVVTSDDPALDFVLRHRGLFGDAPVVFCGANDITPERLAGKAAVVGVTETADYEEGIALALRLHPGVRQILVVVDDTFTGRLVRERMEGIRRSLPPGVTMHFSPTSTLGAVLDVARTTGAETCIFLTIFNRDDEGRFYEYDEVPRLLSESSRSPVYGSWDFYLGDGIVGGILTSGEAQGKTAAELVLEVLKRAGTAGLPLISRSPNRFMFDYKMLQRFGIQKDRLPKDSIVINRPVGFYEQNRVLVHIVVGAFVLLSGFTVSLLVNVMARKRAEAALRVSEARLRGIFENAGEGIFRVTLEGRMLMVNPAMARILRYDSVEDLIRVTSAGAHVLYRDDGWRERYVERLLQDGVVRDFEARLVSRTGGDVWVSISARLLVDEVDGAQLIEGIMADISARKEAELALQAMNASLEARVTERTAELARANDALQKSMDDLRAMQARIVEQEKFAALGGLVAGVAHEMNTPVGVCITSASFLADKVRGLRNEIDSGSIRRSELLDFMSQAEEASQTLVANLERTAELVRAFKRLAVDEAGTNARVIELCPFIDDILGGLRPVCEDAGHRLDYKCSARGITMYVPPPALAQVVGHLVRNSLDHAFIAGVTGRMLLEVVCTEGSVELLFSDDGQGMGPDVLAHIFEPFFTTRRQAGATGLGLHIVYNTVTRTLGGTIECTSVPGEGTRFRIRLPLAKNCDDMPTETGCEPA